MRRSQSDHDSGLLARIGEGDADAFAALVKRHAERFYRVAYRFLSNRAEAEDVVQEAFIALWERPAIWQADRGASFTTWFTRIIVNRCLDIHRRKKPLPIEAAQHVADGDIAADEKLIGREQLQRLEREIARLPERQRTALNLCFYEGFSNREAAQIMKLKVKALQSLLMRAKATLKERLKGEGT